MNHRGREKLSALFGAAAFSVSGMKGCGMNNRKMSDQKRKPKAR